LIQDLKIETVEIFSPDLPQTAGSGLILLVEMLGW
jgi:hypothetical protein